MNYKKLSAEIISLSNLKNVDTSVIGYSVYQRPIYAFHIGDYCENQIIITGAIHAREWITALLVAELVNIYSEGNIAQGGIYFVPLCNPDGVKIALSDDNKMLWKANACGVDLNVNFDADWGRGAQNIKEKPGPENYIGPCPNSEPEVKALTDFTLKVKPKITVAYHSKGEVIYYGFEPEKDSITAEEKTKRLVRDFSLVQKLGEITGYVPEKTKNSTGGYSDWVSMHLGIPAFTIEVGSDEYTHPIGTDKLPEIIDRNKNVPGFLNEYLFQK